MTEADTTPPMTVALRNAVVSCAVLSASPMFALVFDDGGRRASIPIVEAMVAAAFYLGVGGFTLWLNRRAIRQANLVRKAGAIVAGPNRERALATTAYALACFALLGTLAAFLVGLVSLYIWTVPLD